MGSRKSCTACGRLIPFCRYVFVLGSEVWETCGHPDCRMWLEEIGWRLALIVHPPVMTDVKLDG